jgi:hypothetical protein
MDATAQRMTPEQFKERQKEFIAKQAGLTAQEAKDFFPIYFELQDKKRGFNEKAWRLLEKGKDDELSDTEYERNMLEVYDMRIESDQLEKAYYTKFRKVLSPRKIHAVQRAEARFHREVMRTISRPERNRRNEGT